MKEDKIKHYNVGFNITRTSYLVTPTLLLYPILIGQYNLDYILGSIAVIPCSFILAVCLAAVKEIYDEFTGGTNELADFTTTVQGARDGLLLKRNKTRL